MGYMVFDEIDKSASHVLLGQVGSYFIKTNQGRVRSRLIIPEPFFVHSDLTTLIQAADIIAYTISWGLRLKGMNSPKRNTTRRSRSRALRVFVIFSSVNWRRLNSVRHRVRIDLQMQYARCCCGHTATLDGAHFQKTEGLKLVQCAEQIGLRAVGQPSECRNRLRLCIAYRPQQAAIIRREDPDESLG